MLSHSDFLKLAQGHKTAADHDRLAGHFTAHAEAHEYDARIHDELANSYEKSEPRLAGEARHYAVHSREAAEAMRNLARIHNELAAEHKEHSHA